MKPRRSPKDKRVVQLAYHRNGISGLGFHVAIVEEAEDRVDASGKPLKGTRRMLVVRFPGDIADEGTGNVVCAVFDLAQLAAGDIAFGSNSWRGDHYHEVVDRAIEREEGA